MEIFIRPKTVYICNIIHILNNLYMTMDMIYIHVTRERVLAMSGFSVAYLLKVW